MVTHHGHGLLALLDLADMNGDEVTAALAVWAGSAWTADRSEVGETLDRLAHDRLIAVVTRHGPEPGTASVTYTLTHAGRTALTTWLAADGDGATPPRPDLLAKVLLSLPGGRDRALAVITHQRSTLTAALQSQRRAVRQASSEPAPDEGSRLPSSGAGSLRALPPLLVEEARITQAEAELRWLDLCEARVNGGAA